MDDGCCTTTTTEDADSAIVLSREELQNIKDCCDEMDEQTPSTSSAKSSPKRTGLVRKLVRVPCPTNENTPFTVHGGAAKGKLIMIDIVRREDLYGILSPDDRLLSIEGVAVSGMVYSEVRRLLEKLCSEREQVALEVVSAPSISDDIAEILEGKMNPELQNVIRDNLYAKTVPCTTRPAREGEIDGEHYKFVTEEEFTKLKEKGCLLEHGSYQGFFYGTPRPVETVDPETDDMVSATLGKGPLPPNWEIGYAENGEKYFIDHNSGTTTWDDPRLLPDGWEQVDDPYYGTFYVDHLHKRTQYERPGTAVDPEHFATPSTASTAYIGDYDKENPYDQFRGKGNYDVIPTRPPTNGHNYAASHAPHQNGHQYVFTRDVNQLRGEMINTTIIKGPKGLGFTLIGNDASSKGDEFIQVKSILAGGPAAENGSLLPGDVLVRVNGELLLGATQAEACRVFISIPVGDPVAIQICRGYPLMIDPNNRIITENVYATGGRARSLDHQDIEIYKGPEGFGFTIADSVSGQRVRKILHPAQCPNLMEGDTIVELDGRDVRNIPHTQLVDMLRDCQIGHRGRLVVRRSSPKHRSRTPTAAFRYGEQRATPVSTVTGPRSKTPAPTTTRQPSTEMYSGTLGRPSSLHKKSQDEPDFVSRMRPSSTTLGFATPNYVPISQFSKERTSETVTINLIRKPNGFGFRLLGGAETNTLLTVGQIVAAGAAYEDGRMQEGDEIVEIDNTNVEGSTHEEAVRKLEQAAKNKHVKMVVRRPKTEMSHSISLPGVERKTVASEYDVVLNRTDHDGFGFIIISSIDRNGSTIGQILENSPASRSGKLQVGDRVVAVNGRDIMNMTHGEIVNLIKHSGLTVRLTIAPPGGPDAPLASSTLIRNGHHIPPLATSNSVQNSNYAPYGPLRSPVQPYAVVPDPSSRYSRLSNGHHDVIPPESDSSIISVELERGNRGFGFSIRGGQEFGAMPLFVLRIAEDGPAAADSRLRVGDQLISINGRDCTGLTHEEAISIIKSQPTVRLTVRRRSPS